MVLHTLAKNQTVIEEVSQDGLTTKAFFSYDKLIAKTYSKAGHYTEITLYNNLWDYSATTRKWFKKFIDDFTCFTYHDKQNWIEEIESNPHILIFNN